MDFSGDGIMKMTLDNGDGLYQFRWKNPERARLEGVIDQYGTVRCTFHQYKCGGPPTRHSGCRRLRRDLIFTHTIDVSSIISADLFHYEVPSQHNPLNYLSVLYCWDREHKTAPIIAMEYIAKLSRGTFSIFIAP